MIRIMKLRRKTQRRIRGGNPTSLEHKSINGIDIFASQHDGYKTPTEDRYSITPIGETAVLLGVYDGHTGSQIADISHKNIPPLIVDAILSQNALNNPDQIKKILETVPEQYEQKLSASHTSGTTISLVVITPTHIIAGNAGDSPILYFKTNGETIGTSVDHDCENPDELARIKASGGDCMLRQDGVKAVKNKNGVPGLMVTRSIGDFNFKPPVIATLQTYVFDRVQDTYLVVCSDSFTEKIGVLPNGVRRIHNLKSFNDVIAELVPQFNNAQDLGTGVQNAVNKQVQSLYINNRFNGDNTTLLAVRFPPANKGGRKQTRRKRRTYRT